jgi:hypothetical protein
MLSGLPSQARQSKPENSCFLQRQASSRIFEPEEEPYSDR